jgi:RHS repeat-associated protein
VTAGGKEIAQLATDGGFYWLHHDHLGTPRKMTNSTGVVMFRGEYDPHGNPLLEWSVIGNPYLNNNKFTGYERDYAAGLDFAQARHYSYGRGRFMQPDPVRTPSNQCLKKYPRPPIPVALDKPESLNLYTYVFNDPVNFDDPTGTYGRCTTFTCRACQGGCTILTAGCILICLEGAPICPICVPACVGACVAAQIACMNSCQQFGG